MAIIVEEKKQNRASVFNLVGWLALLGVAMVAIYYIFFAAAPTVTIPSLGGLNTIAPLTQSAVQPQTVENSVALQALSTTITAPTSTGPASVTRPNPFLAP
jgi:hypothetical protein